MSGDGCEGCDRGAAIMSSREARGETENGEIGARKGVGAARWGVVLWGRLGGSRR